jgi:hypothetical protein
MTSIYNTGTVTVTNGSAAVVGIGTAWALALVAGGTLSVEAAGNAMPILSVTDNTHLTGAVKWTGTTGTYNYAIDLQGSDVANVIDLNTILSRVLTQLSLAGITPNNSGTLTKRDALTLTADNDNYLYLQAELGVAFAFYRWDGPSLAWVGPFPVANSVATGGVSSIVGTGITVDNTNPGIPVLSIPNDSILNSKLNNMANATVKARLTAGTGDPEDLTLAQFKTLLLSGTVIREVLTASRTYFVGFNMGSATVSIASPGVVTKTTHGLVANSRVSFSILPNTKTATVSVATPAVVTMANTFAAGQPVVFASTGRLPKGLVAGTTYFVIATGLSGSSFQMAATVGGAAINTTAPAFTVTIASPGVVTETAHGRSTGDAIQLATTGALPTGLVAATNYFLNVIDANTYNLRLTPEGGNINTTGTQSGTHSIVQFGTHYLSETGTLPTGITAGQDYFVIATGLTTGAFQFSATSGGAAINTTGAAAGTIVLKTGSDSNSGLAQTAAGAFLTLQAAINATAALDLSVNSVTIQMANGTYLGGAGITAPWIGGSVQITGDTTTPSNILISTTSNNCFSASGGGRLNLRGVKMQTTTAGSCITVNGGSVVTINGNCDFGACATYHVDASGGQVVLSAGYNVSGGALYHWIGESYCNVTAFNVAINLLNVPAFSVAFAYSSRVSIIQCHLDTFNGFATGQRYKADAGAAIFTNGAGASYLPGNTAGNSTGGTYA